MTRHPVDMAAAATGTDARDRPRVVDLFCGAGGLSMGFIRAGYQIAAGVEADACAAQCFESNIEYFQGYRPLVMGGDAGDLRHVEPAALREQLGGQAIDVVVGGPPCKAFSKVGRGKINSLDDRGSFDEDPRNALYHRFCACLATLHPRAFVMENVAGMLSVRGRNLAEVIARDLSLPGGPQGPRYVVRYALLNAAWYGVPQLRQRVIFIGLREDLGRIPDMPPRQRDPQIPAGYLPWPSAPPAQLQLFDINTTRDVHVPRATEDVLAQAVTVGEALDDLPRITSHLADPPERPRSRWRDPRAYRQGIRPEDLPGFARLMRDWDGPGGDRPAGVTAHTIRMTPRDFETFRQMKADDTYPQAHEIAVERLREALAVRGLDPFLADDRPGADRSPEQEREARALRKAIVPPYPTDQGFAERWRKLDARGPSWTVTAHLSRDTYSHIHHDSAQARAISVREAARLQSFPDRFWFGPGGGMNSAFAQIGNAVPPLMASAIAQHLRGLLGLDG